MPDRTLELRMLHKQFKEEERLNATAFEREVKRFYILQKKHLISWGTERHHEIFGVPREEPSADFVIDDGPNSIIIAEAKGRDIDHALEQMKNLARFVRPKEPLREIEFHLLLREDTNPQNLSPAANQPVRYSARPTGDTMLKRTKYVLCDGAGNAIRIQYRAHDYTYRVFVIIGPRAGVQQNQPAPRVFR
jgi:hypothetical protein